MAATPRLNKSVRNHRLMASDGLYNSSMGGANSRQDRPQDEPPRAEEKRLHGKSGGPLLQLIFINEVVFANCLAI